MYSEVKMRMRMENPVNVKRVYGTCDEEMQRESENDDGEMSYDSEANDLKCERNAG
jgi:hypothetical protein